jgi:hypothetical protein
MIIGQTDLPLLSYLLVHTIKNFVSYNKTPRKLQRTKKGLKS